MDQVSSLPKTSRASGCLILFAIPFAVGGLLFAFWMGSALLHAWQVRSWVETPAHIQEVELKVVQRKNSTSQQVIARYQYTYEGETYTGATVTLAGVGNQSNAYQKRLSQELQKYRRTRRPYRCFVNPQQPTEAVLERDISFAGLGGALIAVCAGMGLLAAGFAWRRWERRCAVRAAAHPDEPWLWRADWASARVVCSRAGVLFPVGFAVVWNLLSWPFGWAAWRGEVPFFVWLFPIAGLALAVWALVAVLCWLKYGRSVFEMASVPGVIGGSLAGVVRTSVKIVPERGFCLRLSCIRTVQSGGRNSSPSRSIVWQDEQRIGRELLPAAEQSAIPVLFTIPFDCAPCDDRNWKNVVHWELEVSAATPGMDYKATFSVPVFKTPASRPDFEADRSLIAPYVAPQDPASDLREAGVRRTTAPDGEAVRFIFPRAQHAGTALALTFMMLLFWAVPYGIWRFDPDRSLGGMVFSAVFSVVFGGFGLVLAFVAAELWLYRSVVDVSRRGLSVTAGLWRGRTTRIAAGDVEQFELKSLMGSEQRRYYDLVVRTREGQRTTLGKHLPGRRLAEAVQRQVEEALGRYPAS